MCVCVTYYMAAKPSISSCLGWEQKQQPPKARDSTVEAHPTPLYKRQLFGNFNPPFLLLLAVTRREHPSPSSYLCHGNRLINRPDSLLPSPSVHCTSASFPLALQTRTSPINPGSLALFKTRQINLCISYSGWERYRKKVRRAKEV